VSGSELNRPERCSKTCSPLRKITTRAGRRTLDLGSRTVALLEEH